ncbi:CYTH domain-containing protein [Salipaludibacillus neizhouensis]|uniref:CYTH domain-containing protein n=1 Tax=Salipaludibacillus neizhouensis TaxID=885475 RepID=A0A3A9K3S6_9BACI|nr:CYTH domain-containing protein [Salipaludibacillus neizhouensis]RKL67724.1 CYTH domain-containing protein [Salipaludibacillus neizhouensis]
MSQEIEIEFKNLISELTYSKLLRYYSPNSSPIFEQVNHYFDTKNMGLQAKQSALRVRYKGKKFILTLKQPHKIGLLETHQLLNEDEFKILKQKGTIPSGEVSHQLESLLELPFGKLNLQYLGKLTTERTECNLPEGLLVLDKSFYFDCTDFEMEFECTEETAGRKAFEDLLKSWSLTWTEPPNKIERFYKEKLKRN